MANFIQKMAVKGPLDSFNDITKLGTSLMVGGAAIGSKAARIQKYAGHLSKMISGDKQSTMQEPDIPSYSQFVSMVRQDGLARSNHFTVEFVVPKFSSVEQDRSLTIPGTSMKIPSPPGDVRNMVMMCHSVQLPGVNMATVPVVSTGPSVEMPTGRNYGSLQTSFYVDSRYKDRAIFDRWLNNIQNPVSKNFMYFKDYVTPMVIGVFDRNGDLKYRMDIKNAYPKTIGDVQLSYDSRELMKLDVTWLYTYWTASPIPDLSEVSLSEKLLGYGSTIMDVQNTVNNVAGSVSRALDLAGAGDLGGLAGQSFGRF